MASSEHLALSDFIKTTHQSLRHDAKVYGADEAWKKHCANKEVLEKYATSMRDLATKHWQKPTNDTVVESRIHWVYNFCQHYFFKEELLRQRAREQDIASKINLTVKTDTGHSCNNILKLLDVGSCYNPFKAFECFDVVAVDIAPASADVHLCDFLNLSIVDRCDLHVDGNEISALPRCMFDVVVFSLLLEYLPCPEQRLLCCSNAYDLLKCEGLLIIITPDSKHVGANAKFMKSWRYNLAKIGFSRIKYQKLPHIHCMAFRKSIKLEIADRWANIYDKGTFYDKMLIPQDFNIINVDDEGTLETHANNVKDAMLLLNELPNIYD